MTFLEIRIQTRIKVFFSITDPDPSVLPSFKYKYYFYWPRPRACCNVATLASNMGQKPTGFGAKKRRKLTKNIKLKKTYMETKVTI